MHNSNESIFESMDLVWQIVAARFTSWDFSDLVIGVEVPVRNVTQIRAVIRDELFESISE